MKDARRRVTQARAGTLPAALDRRFEAVVFDWDGTAVPDRERGRERGCASWSRSSARRARPRRRHRHARRQRRRAARRAAGRARAPLPLREPRLRGVRGRTSDGLAARSIAARRRRGGRARSTRAAEATVAALARARARGRDRLAAAEPAEDRPDPGAGVGRSAEGADRASCSTAVEARLRGGRTARASRGGRARARRRRATPGCRSAGDERREARRDRPHRQGRLRALAVRGALAPRHRRRGSCSSPATSSGRSAGCRGATRSCSCPRRARATAVSVGAEPTGVPRGVIALGGGPARFVALLEDQLERRRARRRSRARRRPGLDARGRRASTRELERVHESLLTLADGRIGTRGAPLFDHPAADAARARVAASTTARAPRPTLRPVPALGTAASAATAARPRTSARLDLRTGRAPPS